MEKAPPRQREADWCELGLPLTSKVILQYQEPTPFWQRLLRDTQALTAAASISDDEIAAEIAAYRSRQ